MYVAHYVYDPFTGFLFQNESTRDSFFSEFTELTLISLLDRADKFSSF